MSRFASLALTCALSIALAQAMMESSAVGTPRGWEGSISLDPVSQNGLDLTLTSAVVTPEAVVEFDFVLSSYAGNVDQAVVSVHAIRPGVVAEMSENVRGVSEEPTPIAMTGPRLRQGETELRIVAQGTTTGGYYVSDVVVVYAHVLADGLGYVSPHVGVGPFLAQQVAELPIDFVPTTYVESCVVESIPCQAPQSLEPFSDDPPLPSLGPSTMSHSTFKVSVCWNFVEMDGSWKNQRWADLEVWDDDTTSGDDLLWSGLIQQTDGCITTGDMTRAESFQGNQDVYLIFRMANSAVWVDHDGIATEYRYQTDETRTVGTEDIMPWGEWAPSTGLIGARQFQYANNGWDWGTNYAGRSICCQVQVEAPSNDFSTAFYQDAFDTIHIPAGWDGDPDNTIHEYGHFLMDKWYGSFDPFTGSETHGWCVSGKPRDYVWEEAWANFYGARANKELGINGVPGVDGDDDYAGFPMESQDCPTDVVGDSVEAHVSRTLWDLRDTTNDGEGITYSASVIVGLVDSCDHDNLREYYDKAGCSWSNSYSAADFRAAASANRINY